MTEGSRFVRCQTDTTQEFEVRCVSWLAALLGKRGQQAANG